MLKIYDIPEFEFLSKEKYFKEQNTNFNIIETDEIAFITYDYRWGCFWINVYTMNSETGIISEQPYSFHVNNNQSNSFTKEFDKMLDFLNDSSIFDIFNPKTNKECYCIYNLYNVTAYYFVKDTSVKIKNKISLNVTSPYSNTATAPPIFYALISLGIGFAIPFDLSFDFKYIFDHFENKEITADASRYRFKVEKAANIYDKKIRSLEEKINEVKREKDEALSKINLDEVDKRLFEIFDEDKISAVRLYEILKNKN